MLCIDQVVRNPDLGDLMKGTGGFRKIRWTDARRGIGTRGGLRIIYYYFLSDHQIWPMMVYDKDEAADLTPAQRAKLKVALDAELEARAKKRTARKIRRERAR
jgi:hypothetical protein